MPYKDEAGTEHVLVTDPISIWSQLHIGECEHCRANLFTKLIRNENKMGEYPVEQKHSGRFVEDDLLQLADIDDSIRSLLTKRAELVHEIKKANASNSERLNISEDWLEGDLKGKPVPSRGMDVMAGPERSYDPTQRSY